MPCDPTRALRDEHRLILRVLDALEQVLSGGEDAAATADLRGCVDFFRLFADACHHGKEEDLLFEALVEGGMPRHEGPIAMMLQEHELGRLYVAQMARALEGMEAGEPAWADLLHAGRGYIALLRAHIDKEDGGLFGMADAALDEPACRALCESYQAACGRRFEGRSMADLEALAAGLVRSQPPTRAPRLGYSTGSNHSVQS